MTPRHRLQPAILGVLAAAMLFGASTPLARALVGEIDPLWLAGLLYAGSGLGLSALLLLRRARGTERTALFARSDAPWLAATILCGGIVAPVMFTFGLRVTTGATASLLLNLETVLTVLLAWFVFGEHRNRRVVLGMAAITMGSLILGWNGSAAGFGWGALLIAFACLGWALDNNLTRKISGNDAMTIAAAKGLVGGAINLGLAAALAGSPPRIDAALSAGAVGFLGYGVSLVLFVVALRQLGTARSSAYFALSPVVGVAIAFLLLGERPDVPFWIAALLMAIGVWLHLTERHDHAHRHVRLQHAHAHRHDEHHRHLHDQPWDGVEPHTHPHVHEPLVHEHAHYPDLHHRHHH